jgi:hypothetical protein
MIIKPVTSIAAISLMVLNAPVQAASEFEQWKMQQQQTFQEYKDERDREFTDFLKKQWKEMELLRGFVRDEAPKPVKIPVAKPQPPAPIAKPQPKPEPEPVKKPVEEPVQKPVAKPEPKPVPTPAPVVIKPIPIVTPPALPKPAPVPYTQRKGIKAKLSFFGTPLTFYYDAGFKKSLPGSLNETAVSNFWSDLSKADYDPLLEQLASQKKALALNDWGYAVLVNELGEQIYPTSKNRQALFTWFIMTKAGYRARIAYNDRNAYLLVPSQQQIFEVPYFTFSGERYYAVRFDGGKNTLGRVYTYDGNYPGADSKLDMRLKTAEAESSHISTRKLSFDYNGKRYNVVADYEKSRIDFLNTYPQLDLEMYFDASVSASTANPLLKQLAADMKGMSEQQAVNFLLRFVQTSLKYKTDENQFGKENYLFPEETLYYPYSDCEDRSILFAWLVEHLLGLEVVGLNFPGHVATAVHFKENVAGDAITWNGKRYVVADPTYINASAGMTMPAYKNAKPGVIKIQ